MMDRLREGVNSIAVKIILGLIILSFVFAGVGSYITGGGNNAAAKVGNTEIARGEFEQAYQNERNRMQSQLGDYFAQMLADPAYVESFRKSVLDRMINDVLLEQQAESLGLRISDSQIRTMILEMPQFQTAGQFDQEVYQAALRRAGFSAESFAEYMRRDLMRNQLVTALQGSEFVLQGEIDTQSKLIAQTRDIRTVTLSVADLAKDIELTDEQIEQYYSENPQAYTRPEQAKVSYIELSAEALKSQLEVSDEEAQKYYQEHLDKYSTEEQRKVSHILVQGDDEAKAQSILDELNAGADFATLAEEKSDDFGSADVGGDLGWIERDVMDPAFEDAAFALENIGDTTGLVKSDFGYHIIKLDEIKASQAQPYTEVAVEIKQELLDQRAVDQFYEQQTELEKVAFEFPDSLDDSAEAINAKITTTDFISQVDAPEVLMTPAVMQAILSPEVKEDGLNSEVIEVSPEHVIVVRVEETRDETVLPLAEVKDQVVAALSAVQAEQQAVEL
ncbi:SurA N-terminal domain-containing protein, partial [Vibrio splendidus]|uniref:SurA N-terminal domain-containing protein n=2 Tax=Vibrionaceae TaxID=641 RepID=UPI000C853C67